MSSNPDLRNVQRIVLQRPCADAVAHVLLTFPGDGAGNGLLSAMRDSVSYGPRRTSRISKTEVSLGLTFPGLRSLRVPNGLVGLMSRLAPAWAQGAKARAATFLGDSGKSDPRFWERDFSRPDIDAVLSVHGESAEAVHYELDRLRAICEGWSANLTDSHFGARLKRPSQIGRPEQDGEHQEWVHFGYRDGLSKVWVRGFPNDGHSRPSERPREHELGEFVLGYPNDHGANPWLLPSAASLVRSLFRDGSFGVLRKIEQDVFGFDASIARWAAQIALERSEPAADLRDLVKAKLCGRFPDGRLMDDAGGFCRDDPAAEFDHTQDPDGRACPLTSHIRRMNPRNQPWEASKHVDSSVAHSSAVAHVRTRPLIRRGMPYGDWRRAEPDDVDRGLLGQFFCSSIEAQFEHLLGQWAERSPLGVVGGGTAKDPFIGQHDDPKNDFNMALGGYRHRLKGFVPFCVTRGTVYAFYPSAEGLRQICDEDYADPNDSLELTL